MRSQQPVAPTDYCEADDVCARWQYRRMADTTRGSGPLTQYFVASSIDGFIVDENDNLDWLLQIEGGMDDENPYHGFIENVGALAMGATTYEWINRNHPGDWDYDDRPTWVFTHRELAPIEGANLIFTQDDVTTVHAAMVTAAAGRNIWLVGGGELVGRFMDSDLLDEIWLSIAAGADRDGGMLVGWTRSPQRTTPPPGKVVRLVQSFLSSGTSARSLRPSSTGSVRRSG